MPIPTIAAVGAFNDASTGSLTVTLPAHQADDILIVAHETNVSTGSSTPSGWAHVTGSPRSQGSNVVAVSVLWKRATSSSETNPVFSASANHQIANATAVRGCITSGDPWDYTPVDYGAAATSLSVPGGTTTVTNTRTFVAIANSADTLVDQISAVSNGSLTGFAVIDQEFTDMGNGGGVGVWSGTRTTAGSTGTTSATVVSGSSAALVFSLVGAAASAGAGAATGSIAWAGTATGSRISSGSASGALAWVGASTGARVSRGLAAGAIAWVGSATGLAPIAGSKSGSATGGITWTGTATGSTTRRGSAAGAVAWVGTAAGKAVRKGAATGAITWAGAANGTTVRKGAAVGAITLAGVTTGARAAAGAATGALGWVGAATGRWPFITLTTPATRTITPTDNRTLNIPAENRTTTPTDNRTTTA